MILRYTLAWLVLSFIGILNGAARELGYGRFMRELTAHQVSTLTGIVLFGLCTLGLSYIWKIRSSGQALAIGLIWLALTIAFEFLFGHYVLGHPWSRLFHDYNLLAGRVWVLVLIWITIAPYTVYRLRS